MYLLTVIAGAFQLTSWIMALVKHIEEGGNHADTETTQ